MALFSRVFGFVKKPCKFTNSPFNCSFQRFCHGIPFQNLYRSVTGQVISDNALPQLKKKHPHIESLSDDRLQCTLQILEKFGITPLEACQNPHVFCMNPITMDNYGEILKECGFITILPIHIIRYHTLVRSRTITQLKKEGLIKTDFFLEQVLQNHFQEWPAEYKVLEKFTETTTCILTVRMSVLEKYLHWRLSVTPEDFKKYCRYYLPLKHKPMTDIQLALDLAQNDLKFDTESIRRNGFIISTDPIKTKLIIENVKTIAGMDVKEAIKLEPGILKNTHSALIDIRSILEEYRITIEAQQRCLRVFCMRPETVKQRLDELKQLKEYQVLETNPRVLWMVVHKNKMMSRLTKIRDAKKQCYSLNHLVGANEVFNNYISGFGNKVCGRDIAILISSAVHASNLAMPKRTNSEAAKAVIRQLRRHKYWLHAALSVVDENIRSLKAKFNNEVIFNHCQLLLYPANEIEHYMNHLLALRSGEIQPDCQNMHSDVSYNNLKHRELTDNQILSLVLYEIEKKYHFSGDGIWARQEGARAEAQKA